MKNLLFACLLLGVLQPTAWCDILARPPRRPQTVITVANLKGFPGYKFSCSTYASKIVPLQETQVFYGVYSTNLFVEDGDGNRSQWASVPIGDVLTRTISILDVRRDGKKIKVRYKLKPDATSQEKSTIDGPSPAALFMLSGFSLGAVVLLMRRKRAEPTET